ncbi:NAD(P)/FAD-dependent oxidoreductase [Saliphagus sp. LR7]|uniref:NAD(P)/FAD-dependent oxidoreductase n=1 Tax=Saliphagus sp. LR7 TaxID=2282654 RepID=UPI000DF766BC|nr:FAD-dependent oxidoreductase [Saliphagus sp. LR7]
MSRVAVVVGGVAGAGVATALDGEREVVVFEREGEPGGRTATRRRAGHVYDVGANYHKGGSELLDSLDEGDLIDVEEPVWTFEGDGEIKPGDDRDDHKWTFEDGITILPRRLLERASATVRTGTEVTGLERTGEGEWDVLAGGGRTGPYDAVVLTPPGPASASILEHTSVDSGTDFDPAALAADLESFAYRSIDSFALAYSFPLDRPYYAAVNTDRAHAVGWLAREGEKRGHVPDGRSLLIVQMAPDWSVEHRETPDGRAAELAAGHAAALLDDDRLADPKWTERVSWRHALPDDEAIDANAGEAAGLYVASDATHGEGRIHASLEGGLEIGDRL